MRAAKQSAPGTDTTSNPLAEVRLVYFATNTLPQDQAPNSTATTYTPVITPFLPFSCRILWSVDRPDYEADMREMHVDGTELGIFTGDHDCSWVA